MKVRYLAVALVMALVVVVSVAKGFVSARNTSVIAEASTSTDDGGDDGEYTEFA